MEVVDLFKPLSEGPEMDTSYFKPWGALEMLYTVEPELAAIAAQPMIFGYVRRHLHGQLGHCRAAVRPCSEQRFEECETKKTAASSAKADSGKEAQHDT